MEEITDQETCVALSKLYDEAENRIKTEAKIRRAYIDKVSEDVIREKVDNELNSIKSEIYRINPRFKDGSKNFDKTKQLVSETLANYEKALIDLSEFYDGKIEQLILKKVELEASLIGSIMNEEYLYLVIQDAESQQKNDKVKKSVAENIKATIDKILNRKNEEKIANPQMISKLMDNQDIANDLEETVAMKLEKTANEKNDNKEFISATEKQIAMINDEIERVNDRKKKNIYDAMEVGDKTISSNIRKARVFTKIKIFFISRFNTSKFVENSIIDPLRLRIESFKNNELSNIQ